MKLLKKIQQSLMLSGHGLIGRSVRRNKGLHGVSLSTSCAGSKASVRLTAVNENQLDGNYY